MPRHDEQFKTQRFGSYKTDTLAPNAPPHEAKSPERTPTLRSVPVPKLALDALPSTKVTRPKNISETASDANKRWNVDGDGDGDGDEDEDVGADVEAHWNAGANLEIESPGVRPSANSALQSDEVEPEPPPRRRHMQVVSPPEVPAASRHIAPRDERRTQQSARIEIPPPTARSSRREQRRTQQSAGIAPPSSTNPRRKALFALPAIIFLVLAAVTFHSAFKKPEQAVPRVASAAAAMDPLITKASQPTPVVHAARAETAELPAITGSAQADAGPVLVEQEEVKPPPVAAPAPLPRSVPASTPPRGQRAQRTSSERVPWWE
ncbi:MAG: hypothetical protein ACOY0T_14795 [Myxococcota bacterium]